MQVLECFCPALLDTEVKVSEFILHLSLRDLNPSRIRFHRGVKVAVLDIVVYAVTQIRNL